MNSIAYLAYLIKQHLCALNFDFKDVVYTILILYNVLIVKKFKNLILVYKNCV